MGSNHEHGQHPAWVMISIHAPRMGSDNPACWSLGWRWIFQSTLPGWGATWTGPRPKPPDYYFNPRSPDGEQPWLGRNIGSVPMYFNPRSPDGERPRNPINTPLFVKFQSTLPGWGATSARSSFGSSQSVFQSTLPGWGATPRSACASRTPTHFNPRSPDGERPERISMSAISRDFNPRSPDGERPSCADTSRCACRDFNPRSPDGERLVDCSLPPRNSTISIHAPRMGSDVRVIARMPFGDPISIHAPRMGSDRLPHGHGLRIDISIHAPRMGSD